MDREIAKGFVLLSWEFLLVFALAIAIAITSSLQFREIKDRLAVIEVACGIVSEEGPSS